MVFAREQHGTLDRIVGVLRRRRAKPQTMTVAHSDLPGVLRITVVTDDTEVAIEQLIEQLRKVVDVQQVVNHPMQTPHCRLYFSKRGLFFSTVNGLLA